MKKFIMGFLIAVCSSNVIAEPGEVSLRLGLNGTFFTIDEGFDGKYSTNNSGAYANLALSVSDLVKLGCGPETMFVKNSEQASGGHCSIQISTFDKNLELGYGQVKGDNGLDVNVVLVGVSSDLEDLHLIKPLDKMYIGYRFKYLIIEDDGGLGLEDGLSFQGDIGIRFK